MKSLPLLLALTLAGCNPGQQQNKLPETPDFTKVEDTLTIEDAQKPDEIAPAKVYSNARFKEVTIEKTGEHQFLVQGKGQIFEASFSWVVEDGHEELKQGFQMTDAGAPEWGNFSFTVDVAKTRTNSTLHIILYESSPEDGSRQHELPVFLY
ncbi:MAG: Gmad2 immunoglobulin-like domain-containing protein [Flavobacteriales bacterium]|nr:Gmad2 immunoglobulin-like domain-containing protein [Flavobacteriales bacterium]